MNRNRLTSKIWSFFTLNAIDESKANCNICKAKLSRGAKDARGYGTTSFIKHLRLHSTEFQEYSIVAEAEKKRKREDSDNLGSPAGKKSCQQMLDFSIGKARPFDANHNRQIAITAKIGEMLASCTLPFAVVEADGFKDLMNLLEPRYNVPVATTFSRTIIPEMYNRVRDKLQMEINQAKYVCFTSDVWTSMNNLSAFLSFTAHWIDDSWNRQFALLQLRKMEGSHTGELIAMEIISILEDWNISENRRGILVRDNGLNMVKAARIASLSDLSCYIHSLQLTVIAGLKAQRDVINMIAVGRALVGHFRHSTKATEALKIIQQTLNTDTMPHPQHRLIQDVATRWNSTYYMLERLFEQRRAVALYCQDVPQVTNLNATQWTLAEKVVKTLRPFEEITKNASLSSSSAGIIIPGVRLLQRFLEKPANFGDDVGIQTMRTEMLKSLNTRFTSIEGKSIYALATALDPTYKLNFFSTEEIKDAVKTSLLEECVTMRKSKISMFEVQRPPLVDSTATTSTSVAAASALDDYWLEFVPKQPAVISETDNDICRMEIETYFAEPPRPRTSTPLDATLYWKSQALKLPNLTLCAKKFLTAPSSTVDSERVFSTAGMICSDNRSCLSSKKTEYLLFLKFNGNRI